MKTLPYVFALTVLSLCCLAEEAQYTTIATAATRDGCILKGQLGTKKLSGSTLFCDNLQLDPAQITSLTFTQTNGTTKASLTNGDTFSYKVLNETISIDSSLGTVHIPCAALQSLSFEKRRLYKPDDDLAFSCDFESVAEIPNFTGGQIVAGKNGNALHVTPHTSAAKIDLPAGSIGREGTIEFWGKIDAGAEMTDGGCPRFFEIIDMASRREISQDWNANNGSGGYGLTFRMDGLPVMVSSNYRRSSYESILGDATTWHHYALVWNADGLEIETAIPARRMSSKHYDEESVPLRSKPKAAVLIDGRCIMAATFDSWTGPALSNTTSTLFFPNREDEMPGYARVGYTIDQFRIWKVAKTQFID